MHTFQIVKEIETKSFVNPVRILKLSAPFHFESGIRSDYVAVHIAPEVDSQAVVPVAIAENGGMTWEPNKAEYVEGCRSLLKLMLRKGYAFGA